MLVVGGEMGLFGRARRPGDRFDISSWLPPRSALEAVPLGITPRASKPITSTPAYLSGPNPATPIMEYKCHASAPSIFRASSFGR